MKYRLSDGRVVRSIYGERIVVETIPELRDRVFDRLLGFPFANVVALGLATAGAAAFVVGVWLEQGWSGAANGALSAAALFPVFAFVGAYIAGGVFKTGEAEERGLWRVLIPWGLLDVVVVAWIASTRPWLF